MELTVFLSVTSGVSVVDKTNMVVYFKSDKWVLFLSYIHMTTFMSVTFTIKGLQNVLFVNRNS